MKRSIPASQSQPTRSSIAGLLLLLACVIALAPVVEAQLGSRQADSARQLESLRVLPESYDMRPDIFVLLPEAKRVGLTLLKETSDGLEPVSRSDLRHTGLTWIQCLRQGRAAATRHLKTLKPQITRDGRKIVQYARFTSENPMTSSIFLSPDFLKGFEDTLGKEVYIAIPDRYNVFVFPKLADSIKAVAPKMGYLHKEALYPVSREVFELSKEGIRVIGKF